jgi:hypothetical protein
MMATWAAFSLMKKAATALSTGAKRYENSSLMAKAIQKSNKSENKALQRNHRFTGC